MRLVSKQGAILAFSSHELAVRALLDEAALIEDQNLIELVHGKELMGDHEGCLACLEPGHGVANQRC